MVVGKDGHPFLGDTASRGSQTDPLTIDEITQVSLSPRDAISSNIMIKRGGRSSPLKSRLVDSPAIAPYRANKKRVTIPMSNWECNPEPLQITPTEFGL